MLADELLDVLDDPSKMWSRALCELPRDAQRLFLTLATVGAPVAVDDLRQAYTAQSFEPESTFLDCLRSLDDSFFSIASRRVGSWSFSVRDDATVRYVDFWNPTVSDFSQGYLDENTDWLDAVMGSPVFPDQLSTIFGLAMTEYAGAAKFPNIRKWVRRSQESLLEEFIVLAVDQDEHNRVSRPYGDKYSGLADVTRIVRWVRRESPEACLDLFRDYVSSQLRPRTERELKVVWYLVGDERDRAVLQKLTGIAPLLELRSGILDLDEWKYPYLVTLDGAIAELDQATSLADWGEGYQTYLTSRISDLEAQDSYEGLQDAMREVQDAMDVLGVDLSSELQDIEYLIENFPREPDEDDDGPSEVRSQKDEDRMERVDELFANFERG